MPALLTPFRSDESIDLEAHAHNVATLAARGVDGFLIAGSTGEGPYLETGERHDLVRVALQAAPGATVIGGVHAESLRAALAAVVEVSDAGADAALVVTPTSSVRGRTSMVVQFYRDLADAASLPVMLYSVPSVTGWELPIEAVDDLAGHPTIVGMKDSGGDAGRLAFIRERIDAGFAVYAGASRSLVASHAEGAHGAITASANYAFPLVSLAAQGDSEAQQALISLTSVIEPHGIPGTKSAAAITGLRAGASRRPLQPVSQEVEARIEEIVGRVLGT